MLSSEGQKSTLTLRLRPSIGMHSRPLLAKARANWTSISEVAGGSAWSYDEQISPLSAALLDHADEEGRRGGEYAALQDLHRRVSQAAALLPHGGGRA